MLLGLDRVAMAGGGALPYYKLANCEVLFDGTDGLTNTSWTDKVAGAVIDFSSFTECSKDTDHLVIAGGGSYRTVTNDAFQYFNTGGRGFENTVEFVIGYRNATWAQWTIAPGRGFYYGWNACGTNLRTAAGVNHSFSFTTDWITVSFVWDGITVKTYVNGELKYDESFTVKTSETYKKDFSFPDNSDSVPSRRIYSMRAYSSALSAPDIAGNYEVDLRLFGDE